MAWKEVAENWRERRGRVREQWGKLTDDDLDRIDGRREHLLAILQQRYAKTSDVLDREVRDFEQSVATSAAGSDAGEKGTGLEGSVGTSGRTGSEAGGSAEDRGRARGGDYAEPPAGEESGSRGGAGGRSAEGEGGDGRVGGGSSSARGMNGEDRG